MKKIFLIFLISSNICLSAKAQEEPAKLFEFESAIIYYDQVFVMPGPGTMKGSYTMYFDHGGERSANYITTEMNMGGQLFTTNMAVISQDETAYSIDLDRKIGYKMALSEIKNHPELNPIPQDMWKTSTKVGEEEILGKPCDVLESPKGNTRSWVWKSLPLKTEVSEKGIKVTMIATKIETDVEIPDEKFHIPEEIKFTDGMPTPEK